MLDLKNHIVKEINKNKTITIFTKSKSNQLNNIHYFLYSKIIWEECMVSLLRAHGKNVMIGSDSQDINGIDMLVESKEIPGRFLVWVIHSKWYILETESKQPMSSKNVNLVLQLMNININLVLIRKHKIHF